MKFSGFIMIKKCSIGLDAVVNAIVISSSPFCAETRGSVDGESRDTLFNVTASPMAIADGAAV
jgi:hypothetical protein